MKNSKDNKALLMLLLIVVVIAPVYLFVGKFARGYLLHDGAFASWTYNSQNPYLNVTTSWDSGFYYSLATAGYTNEGEDMMMTSITVPEKSWIKLFTGAGLIGNDKFALPYSKDGNLISNTVFLVNNDDVPKSVPLYYAYEGITHCMYRGEIFYDRDVQPISEALTNPNACGEAQCSQVYLTYYDLSAGAVVYQEEFSDPNNREPQKLIGEMRPLGLPSETYIGYECRTVRDFDLKTISQMDYRSNYTNLSFMPLYPFLAKYLGMLVGDVVLSGFIISFIAFIFSVVVLYKLARINFSEKESFTVAFVYVLLPFSFFNLMFLPVALFNLALFMTLLFTLKGKTAFSAISFVALVYLHWYGFLLLIPLFYLNREKKSLSKFYALLLASICAFMPYLWFQYSLTGDWFAFLLARTPWYAGASSFVGSTVNYFSHLNIYSIFEFCMTFVVLVYLFIRFNKRVIAGVEKTDHVVYEHVDKFVLTFLVLIILNGGLTGTFEFWGFLIPLFLVLGKSLSSKGISKYFILSLFAVLNFILFILWTISSRFVV